jgi:superoxide dismutase
MNTSQWSLENDIFLYQNKDLSTKQVLADHFNKTVGAINARLKHLLLEPFHKAYKRLHESYLNKLNSCSNLSNQDVCLKPIDSIKRKSINNETFEVLPKCTKTEDLKIPQTSCNDVVDLTGYNDLNLSQKQIFNSMAERKNVFITGAAGVGKSTFAAALLGAQMRI